MEFEVEILDDSKLRIASLESNVQLAGNFEGVTQWKDFEREGAYQFRPRDSDGNYPAVHIAAVAGRNPDGQSHTAAAVGRTPPRCLIG